MLSDKISHFIQERCLDKLQEFDKKANKQRKAILNSFQLIEFEEKNRVNRMEVENSFIPSRWLTDAAKRAKQISIVTHALKFTHTDAKGSSVYMSLTSNPKDSVYSYYLSTASLPSIQADVVGNAAALDVARLLQLEQDGESLIALIARGDGSALRRFADSEAQLLEWINGFQQALKPKELSSHTLAKQLFFPINDTEYHLLSPLFASSLAQVVFQRIQDSRYSDLAKETRKMRREKKYSINYSVDYPGVLTQNFGGTKPQNVSQLNSSRGGKSYLLNCAPPVWSNQHLSPPSTTTCVIKNQYNRLAHRQAKKLQKYLLGIQDKSSNKERRERRAEYVDELITILLNYAAQIRRLPPGWSAQSKLARVQQLWLDPYREDPDFQQEREKNDWQAEIIAEFAHWLNQKIKHEKLSIGDPEYQHFYKILRGKLRELEEDLEVTA